MVHLFSLSYSAQALWEQLRKKSEIYQSDVVLMPHGDDFRYNFDSEWTKQFENLIKIMEYINKNKDMHMKARNYQRNVNGNGYTFKGDKSVKIILSHF